MWECSRKYYGTAKNCVHILTILSSSPQCISSGPFSITMTTKKKVLLVGKEIQEIHTSSKTTFCSVNSLQWNLYLNTKLPGFPVLLMLEIALVAIMK